MGCGSSLPEGGAYSPDRTAALSPEATRALVLEKLRLSLFSGLMTAQQLGEFAQHFTLRSFPAEACVIKKGASLDALYIVGEGNIRMEVDNGAASGASPPNKQRNPQVNASASSGSASAPSSNRDHTRGKSLSGALAKNLLCVKKPGEYFGESIFLADQSGVKQVHDLNVVTSEECLLLVLPRAAYVRFTKSNPEMVEILRNTAVSMESQLGELDFFKGIDKSKMKMLVTMFAHVPLMAGTVLFKENDFDRESGNSLYFLLKGKVKVTNQERKSNGEVVEDKLLNTLSPGVFLGEVAMMMVRE
jgi:CRP-like cAMP-binding protein